MHNFGEILVKRNLTNPACYILSVHKINGDGRYHDSL